MKKLLLASLAFTLCLANTNHSFADDPKPATESKAKKDTDSNNPGVMPRTIYVPFDKLDEIFEKNDRGIYMSYKEFLELLKKAQSGIKPQVSVRPEARPPADFVLEKSVYEGQAADHVVRFSAQFGVEVLRKKAWVTIPLGIEGVAFSKVSSKTRDAIIVRQNGKARGYKLLVKGAGELPVEADFVVPINDSKAGERSFTFQLPESAISSFRVRLPEKGLKVAVSPSLSVETKDDGEQTVVTAYLSSGGPVTVKWWPRPKEVKGQKALLYADTTTAMCIEEGVVRTSTRIRYRIHQAAAQSFDVAFPKEYKILSVSGENQERWDPLPSGQGFRVKLRSPVKKPYELTFRLERIVPDVTKELFFPDIHTLNTEREVSTACIVGSKLLKLKIAKATGVTQRTMSMASLSQGLLSNAERSRYQTPLAFSTQNKFKLSVQTTRVKPEVSGQVSTLAIARDNEISVRSSIKYLVKRRGIFSVKVQLPQGFNLLECGNEQTVKDYRVEDGVLEVDIPYQVLGKPYVLTISGNMPRSAQAKTADFPIFKLLNVKKETGYLAMAAAKHLELTTDKSQGLVAMNPDQLLQKKQIQKVQGSRASGLTVDISKEDLTLAFKYAKAGGSAKIGIKKRNPKIDADVQVLANAEEDLLKVEGTVTYKIKYAGVDTFRLRVPVSLAKGFKIEGKNIKEKSPKDSPEGLVYTVKTQSKQLDSYQLKYRYEVKFADLKPGAETEVGIASVRVLDVANERGDLALIKHENLVIREVPGSRRGLENRDVTELPQELKKSNVFRAYRFLGEGYDLKLLIVKYDFKAPLGTLINHLHIDEVVTSEGTVQTEAWILLQNTTEQFLRVRMPKTAVMKSLRVAGQKKRWSLTPENKDHKEILVNLANQSGKTEPFMIRMRYDVPNEAVKSLGSAGQIPLSTPHFPLAGNKQVPVTRFTRQVVFGPNVTTLDFDTDMTRHFSAEPGLWNELKSFVFTPIGQSNRTYQVFEAIQRLKSRDILREGRSGPYAVLKNSELVHYNRSYGSYDQDRLRLFSKLNGSAALTVGYVSWARLYTFDVLAFIAIIFLGLSLERREKIAPALYFAISAGITIVLATFTEGSTAHFLRSAFLGSSAVGGFWLARGLWREFTVERQRRLIEVLDAETRVARARAAAAEAETRPSSTPTAAAAPAPKLNVQITEAKTSPEAPHPVDMKLPPDMAKPTIDSEPKKTLKPVIEKPSIEKPAAEESDTGEADKADKAADTADSKESEAKADDAKAEASGADKDKSSDDEEKKGE